MRDPVGERRVVVVDGGAAGRSAAARQARHTRAVQAGDQHRHQGGGTHPGIGHQPGVYIVLLIYCSQDKKQI